MQTAWIALVLGASVTACATSARPSGLGGDGGDDPSGSPASSSQSSSSAGGVGGAGGQGGMGGATGSGGQGGTGGQGGGQDGGVNLCGNGVIDPPEKCDGTDFGGKTCQDFGLSGGMLICNAFCGIVASQCTPAESCKDGLDNDQDSLTDCEDPDCATDCSDSCNLTQTTIVPAYIFGDLIGKPSVYTTSCTGGTSGAEQIYEVTAPISGDMKAHLDEFGTDMSLSVRTQCMDTLTEIACRNDSVGGAEDLGFPVTQGTKYYIMVDTAGTLSSYYNLQIEMVFPESTCDDYSDDDADGYLDCDDPTDCQALPFCIPGTAATGEACFGNTQCVANANDPICLPDFMGYPGGYCSEFCSLTASDCAGDALCADLGLSTNGVCLDGCMNDMDCRPGYACVDMGLATNVCGKPPENLCADYQDNDGDTYYDCEDATSCQTLPACISGPGLTGGPCNIPNDCSANNNDPFCISEFFFNWPGGYCSEFCDLAVNDCSPGALCGPNQVIPSNQGICYDTCNTSFDCRTGYSCIDIGLSQFVCMW